MPIYEYLCESCGMVNEKLQKLTDPPPGRCDECGSKKLAKLVSRSAFQLKGGGWYSDLYASKKKEAPAKEGARGGSAPTKPAAEAKAGDDPGEEGRDRSRGDHAAREGCRRGPPGEEGPQEGGLAPAPSTWPSGPACPSRRRRCRRTWR